MHIVSTFIIRVKFGVQNIINNRLQLLSWARLSLYNSICKLVHTYRVWLPHTQIYSMQIMSIFLLVCLDGSGGDFGDRLRFRGEGI